MSNKNELSAFEIIFKGYLLVNIPIIIIIFIVWYFSITYFELSHRISIFIGCALGWVYWEFTIKKWVKWAFDNNVEPVRLLKIGKLSLLLWNRSTIDKVLNEKK